MAGSKTALPEVLRKIMEVNFFAAAELVRGAIPLLREGEDSITRQRRFHPWPSRRTLQQRVLQQQVRAAWLERIDPPRTRPRRHRTDDRQPWDHRHRVF